MTEATTLLKHVKLKPIMSVSEISDLLGVSRDTIIREREKGNLKGVKVGGHWRFPTGQPYFKRFQWITEQGAKR
jgi:excisionase family DNA binding protein